MKDASKKSSDYIYSETPDVKFVVNSDIGNSSVELWYSPIPKYKSKIHIKQETPLNGTLVERRDAYNYLVSSSRKIGFAILSLGSTFKDKNK